MDCSLPGFSGILSHSLSMGFPRQEYWSGLPFPSPGDLLNLGIELMSPSLAGRLSTAELPGITLIQCRQLPYALMQNPHLWES